jgi:subtilisin family serine protease
MRPDFLAPGHYVISTLARAALLAAPNGTFGEELIVDADHAALAGTSMSAPFGTGAIALLFQRDPTLTQEDARAILQAGSRRLADDPPEGGQPDDYAMGAGILDLEGAQVALDRRGVTSRASSIFLRLGSSYLAADGGLPVTGLVITRDGAGRPADVEGGLGLALGNARIHAPFEHPAVGLYRFAIKALPGHAGEQATVSLYGGLSLTRTLPIGADRWDARDGVRAGGGCSMSAPQTSPAAFALLSLMFLRRSRARSRVRATSARRDGTA